MNNKLFLKAMILGGWTYIVVILYILYWLGFDVGKPRVSCCHHNRCEEYGLKPCELHRPDMAAKQPIQDKNKAK